MLRIHKKIFASCLTKWLLSRNSITDSLILILPRLQGAVVSALSALCEEYYQSEPGQADSQIQGEVTVIH